MKHIKVKFVDFWPDYEREVRFIVDILQRHFEVELCDDPEYLFYSCFGHEHLNYTDCVKICLCWENFVPDFNLCDYAIASMYLEYGDRYFRFPYYADHLGEEVLYGVRDRDMRAENRQRFCSFVHANRSMDPMRLQILDAVNAYKPVDCGGKINHNVEIGHTEGNHWQEDLLAFEQNYKFALACENTSHPGYTTEKIVIAFLAGAIPIYWGDPRIKEVFNGKAFVCAADYGSPEAVARRVREIDTDDALYQSMIREPVLLDETYYHRLMTGLEAFLCHIMEPPLAAALRRNAYSFGKDYQSRLQTLYRWKETYQETIEKLEEKRVKRWQRRYKLRVLPNRCLKKLLGERRYAALKKHFGKDS